MDPALIEKARVVRLEAQQDGNDPSDFPTHVRTISDTDDMLVLNSVRRTEYKDSICWLYRGFIPCVSKLIDAAH